jgi:hypothetical protein
MAAPGDATKPVVLGMAFTEDDYRRADHDRAADKRLDALAADLGMKPRAPGAMPDMGRQPSWADRNAVCRVLQSEHETGKARDETARRRGRAGTLELIGSLEKADAHAATARRGAALAKDVFKALGLELDPERAARLGASVGGTQVARQRLASVVEGQYFLQAIAECRGDTAGSMAKCHRDVLTAAAGATGITQFIPSTIRLATVM